MNNEIEFLRAKLIPYFICSLFRRFLRLCFCEHKVLVAENETSREGFCNI